MKNAAVRVFLFRGEPLQMIAEDPLKRVLAIGRSRDGPATADPDRNPSRREREIHGRRTCPTKPPRVTKVPREGWRSRKRRPSDRWVRSAIRNPHSAPLISSPCPT